MNFTVYLKGAEDHVIKTYGEVEVKFHAFLTKGLDGGKRSAF
jgi:hypothetical protein